MLRKAMCIFNTYIITVGFFLLRETYSYCLYPVHLAGCGSGCLNMYQMPQWLKQLNIFDEINIGAKCE